MSYSVAKNTSFLTAASILQKVISFVYFTIIARLIGVGNTGEYFFAIAFTTVFAVVADFGLGPVLTREAAKYQEKIQQYLNAIFSAKLILGLFSYGLVILCVNLLNYPVSLRHLVYLSGVTMFFDNLHGTLYGVLRAHKNLIFESIGVVSSQFITLIIGSTALFLGWGNIWLIAAFTIPSFLNVLYVSSVLRRRFDLRLYWQWNWPILKQFFAIALPFALAGIISRLYAYADSILMSKMLSKEYLGWWSVPYKITFAFQFIPSALCASIYPVVSGLTVKEADKIGPLFEKSWRYLFTIVFPLSFGLISLAQPIIIKLYKPDFLPAVNVLRILMISLIFTYLGAITGAVLNAINHQKTQTALTAAALVFNVTLNLFLIPRWQIMGAAIAALSSSLILSLGGFWFVRKYVALNFSKIFKYLSQALLPAALMGGVCYYFSTKINFLFIILAAALLYFVLLYCAGGWDLELIKRLKNKVGINS